MLRGEGEYNVNVMTEIEASDSYLGLDEDIRKCQNEEPLYNCTTRKYIDSILSNCGCLPLSIWMQTVSSFNIYCQFVP